MSQVPAIASVADAGSDFNATDFLILQRLARVNTGLPVKIVAVHGGGVSAPCFVDILPMVNQLDGNGAAVPHGTVFNLPVFRLQGGSSAVVLDPVIGDIGLAVFCSRDISTVKKTKAQANPGSRRKHSLSDGIYFGGILNAAPSQYVVLTPSGVKVVSPMAVEIDAPTTTINGSLTVNGMATITGNAMIASRSFIGHEHINGGGTGNSGPVA